MQYVMKIMNKSILPLALMLTVIAVGSGVLDYFVPVMGDDLMFRNTLGLDGYTYPDRSTLSFILGHYTGCNGRFFDFMGPVVLNLFTRAVSSAVMGCMVALFFCSVIRLACIQPRRHIAFCSLVMLITLAVMPWWDAMFLRVCQFNYMWGTAFCLLFIYSFFRDRSKNVSVCRLLLLFMLGFFAGSSHEQTGVALSLTMAVWIVTVDGRRSVNLRRKYLMAGLLAGTLFVTASPALWDRTGESVPGEPIPSILITTYPVLLLLYGIVMLSVTTPRGRACLSALFHSDWIVIAVSATAAALIGLVSGIPGRTGFYSEACAVIAIARMVQGYGWHFGKSRAVNATVYIVSLTLITMHFAVSIQWQRIMHRESEEVRQAYIASSDGIVCHDTTDRLDVPFLTLYRVKGVADADDVWNLHAVETAYGRPGKTPAVIPSGFGGYLGSFTDSISIGQVTLYTARPRHMVITADDLMLQYYPGPSPRVVTPVLRSDGREIWIATPRVRDPGDYSLPVKSVL